MIWTGFILGLLGSWHCIGMCGPIALMVPGAKGKNRIFTILLYHSGKILAYLIIGSFFGLFTAFVTSFKIQAVITISAGVIMALIAFLPALFNYIERKGFQSTKGLIKIKNGIQRSLNKNKIEYSLYIGFLNGFIPCGMVYLAALGVMAQTSYLDSLLFMVLFGIGTMPFLSLFIFISGYFKTRFKSYANKFRMLALCLIGGFMIWQGVSKLNTTIEEPVKGEAFQICHA